MSTCQLAVHTIYTHDCQGLAVYDVYGRTVELVYIVIETACTRQVSSY